MSWFLLIGVMSLAFYSCTLSLDDAVQQMQKKLPYDAGDGIKITKVENASDNVVFTMTTDEKEVEMNNPLIKPFLKALDDNFKEEIFKEDDFKTILSLCKEENKGFQIVMTGEKTGESVTLVELTAEELQKNSDL